MDNPLRFKDERLKRLMSKLGLINDGTTKMALASNHLSKGLQKLRSEGNYASYIVIGTNSVEFLLDKLFTLYVYALNLSAIAAEVASKDYYPYELDLKAPSTSGQILKNLKEKFKFDVYNEELYGQLDSLIKKRNEIAHELIDTFDGDLSKVNESLKNYSETEPIETLSNKITALTNDIVVSIQAKLNSEAVQKNLVATPPLA